MKATRIRWGILGAGAVAQRFAEDMRHSKTGTLVAVGARSLAKAEQFAAQFQDVTPFDDYAALAQQANVDAIYVATPNAFHAVHCLIAIDAGKAVLCEKPFAISAEQGREVTHAAAAANVFCMEAMWTRFLPSVAALHAIISAKDLGAIVHLEVSLGFARTEMPGYPITDPALGGGVVPDLAVYGLCMAQDLLGPFDLVSSDVVWSATGASRTAIIVLRHGPAGPLSVISVSHETQLTNTLVVSGSKARATLDAPFIQARSLRIAPVVATKHAAKSSGLKKRLLHSGLGSLARRGIQFLRPKTGKLIGAEFLGSGLQFEIDEVGRCYAAGLTQSTKMPLDISISVLKTLDAVQKRDERLLSR